MVQHAYSLWRALEKRSGTTLLLETGGVMVGRPDSDLVQGARRSAELHGLPHEMLMAEDVRERFPALQPAPDMVAIMGTARWRVVCGRVHHRASGRSPTPRCRAALRRNHAELGAQRKPHSCAYVARRIPGSAT